MPDKRLELNVMLDETKTVVKVPITATTRMGEVLQHVASKVSRRPNLLQATLRYRGAPLPLDMRACGLPDGAMINFYMPPDNTMSATTDAALSQSRLQSYASQNALHTNADSFYDGNTTLNVNTTTRSSGGVMRNTLLIQIPHTGERRRIHVDLNQPVRCLRDALQDAVPVDWLIHYNKRPILDESRPIHTLKLSDKYLITFGPYEDTSYLTASAPGPTSLENTYYSSTNGKQSRMETSVVLPPSQQHAMTLSQLRLSSPTRRRAANGGSTDYLNGSRYNDDVPASRLEQEQLAAKARAASVMQYGVPPQVATTSSSARSATRNGVSGVRDLYSSSNNIYDDRSNMSVARGDLFEASQRPTSALRQSTPLPRSQQPDFSDIRSPIPPRATSPHTPLSDFRAVRAPVPDAAHSSSYYGLPNSVIRSPNTDFRGGAGMSSFVSTSATSQLKTQKKLKIFVSDPEDGGFTHEVEVNPDRPVSCLRQFVEDVEGYDIHCDTLPVRNDTQTTFWQATGGCDGSMFSFVPRRSASRY